MSLSLVIITPPPCPSLTLSYSSKPHLCLNVIVYLLHFCMLESEQISMGTVNCQPGLIWDPWPQNWPCPYHCLEIIYSPTQLFYTVSSLLNLIPCFLLHGKIETIGRVATNFFHPIYLLNLHLYIYILLSYCCDRWSVYAFKSNPSIWALDFMSSHLSNSRNPPMLLFFYSLLDFFFH